MYAVFQTRRFGDITIRYIWSNSFISAFDTIRYYRDSFRFGAIGYCDLTRYHCTILVWRDWKISLRKIQKYNVVSKNNRIQEITGERTFANEEDGNLEPSNISQTLTDISTRLSETRVCWIPGLRIRNPGFEVAKRTRRNPRNFIDLSITARQRRREYGNRATPTHRGEPPWLLAPFVFKRVASSTRIFAETVTIPREL